MVAAEHDEPSPGPQCAEGPERDWATERVEHDVDALAAGQLAHSRQEVLVAVVDRDRAEPLDGGHVARGTGPEEAKPRQCSQLELGDADPSGSAVYE